MPKLHSLRVQKPDRRPVLIRNNPLYRGLVFASAVGWERGFTQGELGGAIEDVGYAGAQRRHHGVWNVDPKANGVVWNPYGGGMAIDEGPSPPDKRLVWEDVLGVGNPTFGVTVAAYLRKEGATLIGDGYVLGKRDGITGAFPGYNLQTDNAPANPAWAFEICSAAGVQAYAGPAGTFQFVDIDTILVGTYDQVNVSLWQDGELMSQTGATFAIGANTNPFAMFNIAAGGQQLDGAIAMGAVWNRSLSPSEIQRLYADPYTLWRQGQGNQFFNMFGPGNRRIEIDGCCPCEC